ncbi:hypothetical protein LCGC14_1785910 [marine sediment metagenome]|uniref:Uncharacterized protein n=1 Tax=marine sediment metagenome TaxID=412755 RepID=A0A0F9J902_9ZZZZ
MPHKGKGTYKGKKSGTHKRTKNSTRTNKNRKKK